jgi:hypothetical protein
MKKFEVKLLLDAIDKYCYKKNKDADFKNKLINDVKESVDYWRNLCVTDDEADIKFSEHFWSAINKVLTEGSVKALLLRYESGKKFREIGSIEGYSRACAEQKISLALVRIVNPKIWRTLLFDEIYSPTLKTTITEDSIYSTTLSNSVKKKMKAYIDKINDMNGYKLDYTITNIAKYLTSPLALPRSGIKTSSEVIMWFENNGYPELSKQWKVSLMEKGFL